MRVKDLIWPDSLSNTPFAYRSTSEMAPIVPYPNPGKITSVNTEDPMIQQKTNSAPVSLALPVPTNNERYFAGGMHVASIFFPILAPAIVFALSGNSKFIKSHSYQAIFETVALKVLVFLAGAISLTYTAVRLWTFYQNNWEGFSLWPMLARFAIGWIILALLEVANTIVSIRQAYHAVLGNWPKREIRKAVKQSRIVESNPG